MPEMMQQMPQQEMLPQDAMMRSQLRQVMLRLLMQRRMRDRANPMGMQMPTQNDMALERRVGNTGSGY